MQVPCLSFKKKCTLLWVNCTDGTLLCYLLLLEKPALPEMFYYLSQGTYLIHIYIVRTDYTVLYYTTLYYTILYYTILYYTILYYSALHCTELNYTILYYTILYYTILYYTILYYTILWDTKSQVPTEVSVENEKMNITIKPYNPNVAAKSNY